MGAYRIRILIGFYSFKGKYFEKQNVGSYTEFEKIRKMCRKPLFNFNEANLLLTKGNIIKQTTRSQGSRHICENDVKVTKSDTSPILSSLISTVLSLVLWIGVFAFLFRRL